MLTGLYNLKMIKLTMLPVIMLQLEPASGGTV